MIGAADTKRVTKILLILIISNGKKKWDILHERKAAVRSENCILLQLSDTGGTALRGRQSELGKVTLAVDHCGDAIFIARTSIPSLKDRIPACGTRGTPEFGRRSLDLKLNTARYLGVLLNLYNRDGEKNEVSEAFRCSSSF